MSEASSNGSGNSDRAVLHWLAALLLVILGILVALKVWLEPKVAQSLLSILYITLTSTPTLAAIWFGAAGLGWPIRRFVLKKTASPMLLQLTTGFAVLFFLAWILAWAGVLNLVTSWALCVAGATILLAPAFEMQKREGSVRLEPPAIPLPLLVAMPTVGVMIVACCVPPGLLWTIEAYGYDVLSYHLQLPQEWMQAGRMSGLNHNVYSYFPSLVEVAYMLIGSMRGSMYQSIYGAQLLHASLAILAALAVGAIASVPAGRTAGAISAAAFLVMPWTLVTGTLAYDEMFTIVFGASAILLAIDPAAMNVRAAGVAGFLCGVATLAKLTAGPNLAFPAGVLLLLGLRHAPFLEMPIRPTMTNAKIDTTSRISQALSAATSGLFNSAQVDRMSDFYMSNLRFCGVAVLVGCLTLSPYFARNAIETGNPVFPFAPHVFGSGHWSIEEVDRFEKAHGASEDVTGRVGELYRQWIGNTGYGALGGVIVPRVGIEARNIAHFTRENGFPLFLILAFTFAAAASTSKKTLNVAIAMICLLVFQLAFWMLTTHLQSRFLFFTLVPVCVLFGVGVGRLMDMSMLWLRVSAVAVAMAVLLVTAQSGVTTLWMQTPPDMTTGRNLRPSALIDQLPSLEQLRAAKDVQFICGDHPINHVPEGSKVMLVADESRLLYIRVPIVYASAFDLAPIGEAIRAAGGDTATSKTLSRTLLAENVTHLWVHWSELERLRETYGFDRDVTPEKLHELTRDWDVVWPPAEEPEAGVRPRKPDACLYRVPGGSIPLTPGDQEAK